MKYSALILPLTAFVFLLTGCRKGDKNSCDGVGCTEEFRTFSVRLVTPDGTAPVLDSVQTSDACGNPLRSREGRAVYRLEDDVPNEKLFATVVSDDWVYGNKNRAIQATFRGFRNGVVLFRRDYTISADCCHIQETTGPDSITVPD